jgi:hypothetical protein
MNQQMAQMVKEAGIGTVWDLTPRLIKMLERLVELAQAAEREECASLCDLYAMPDGTSQAAIHLALAIRARGKR